MARFDVEFARRQFPAFSHPETSRWAFFENAGGSYAAKPVIDRLHHFMTATKLQPYGWSAPSREAGAAMDRSYALLAEAVQAEPEEVNLGPSTSINTYVLAQSFRELLRAGDEVIVTNQDHEANVGVWRRLSGNDTGIVVKEWGIDRDTGLLDEEHLEDLLSDRTKLVCVSHCSNIVGAINDIPAIARRVHDTGGMLAVDGVSFAASSGRQRQRTRCRFLLLQSVQDLWTASGTVVCSTVGDGSDAQSGALL